MNKSMCELTPAQQDLMCRAGQIGRALPIHPGDRAAARQLVRRKLLKPRRCFDAPPGVDPSYWVLSLEGARHVQAMGGLGRSGPTH